MMINILQQRDILKKAGKFDSCDEPITNEMEVIQ